MRGRFDIRTRSSRTPAELYELLIDARSWPRWGTVDELVLDRSEGIDPDGRDGVGAVRAFRTGRVVVSERITHLEPDRCSPTGAPVAGGSLVRWSGRYTAGFPVGLLLRFLLARTVAADGPRAGRPGPRGRAVPSTPLRTPRSDAAVPRNGGEGTRPMFVSVERLQVDEPDDEALLLLVRDVEARLSDLGCLSWEAGCSVDEPGVVIVVERWRDASTWRAGLGDERVRARVSRGMRLLGATHAAWRFDVVD